MNTNDPRLELMRRCLDGEASGEELAQLEAGLHSDQDLREAWVRYANLDWALTAALPSGARPATAWAVSAPRRQGWLPRRPLWAAAAGLVLGLSSASLVFGLVVQRGGEKRAPVPVLETGFENPQMTLAEGFRGGTGHWSGDAAQVVAAENGVSPKEGRFMLRLDPKRRGAPHVYQVLDLPAPPPGAGGESREIEISASFATLDPEASLRYVIRASAVTEVADSLDAGWPERRDEAIASATRGLDVKPGMRGWQTVRVTIQVPRTARSLVLSFAVRTPDKSARTSPHYLDDVRVSLLTTTTPP